LPEALDYVKTVDREAQSIKNEIFRLCWYMRGGITLDEGFMLSFDDRTMISELIKENLETTKKTGMAFF